MNGLESDNALSDDYSFLLQNLGHINGHFQSHIVSNIAEQLKSFEGGCESTLDNSQLSSMVTGNGTVVRYWNSLLSSDAGFSTCY